MCSTGGTPIPDAVLTGSPTHLRRPSAPPRPRHLADTGVLDESVPFLEGRLVHAEEEGYYDLPQVSGQHASLYEHCVRAINNGLRFGEHGLPLMGCGDWNDGMNLVGEHGKGKVSGSPFSSTMS